MRTLSVKQLIIASVLSININSAQAVIYLEQETKIIDTNNTRLAKSYSGEDCNKNDCVSFYAGKVEFKSEVKFDITAFGVYKYEYKNNVAVPINENVIKGGNCGG